MPSAAAIWRGATSRFGSRSAGRSEDDADGRGQGPGRITAQERRIKLVGAGRFELPTTCAQDRKIVSSLVVRQVSLERGTSL